MIHIKYISLNVAEEIKHILPDTLEKDLQDNEEICPVCHGLGIVPGNYQFGVKEDDVEKAFSLNWYKNDYLTFCPNCYFGRIKTCKYCGKSLPRNTNKCDCDGYKEYEEEEKRIKYQKTISRGKEIELKNASNLLYDEESHQFFSDETEFVEHYRQEYLQVYDGAISWNAYFDINVPEVLWNCEEIKMSIDADWIIENACDELHEDAKDFIVDEKELQEFLNKWCAKQIGTTSYYPSYKEYVKVQKEWFD